MIEAGATLGQVRLSLPLDPLENRILLCHALRLPRVALITQSERVLTPEEAALLAAPTSSASASSSGCRSR